MIGKTGVIPPPLTLTSFKRTFKGNKKNLVVWNRDGKEIIHALRDVDDEGSM
jgi:hypothetical protein